MPMKIPKSVRIGGVEYKVKFQEIVRLDNALCYGAISYPDTTIQISETDAGKHQHQCVTLWHEILHGIINHACMKVENEEEIVEVLSKGIYQVLQDNGRRFFDLADTTP